MHSGQNGTPASASPATRPGCCAKGARRTRECRPHCSTVCGADGFNRFSDYRDCFPLQFKNADIALRALLKFFGNRKPTYVHTDMAPEPVMAVKQLKAARSKSCASIVKEPVDYLSTLVFRHVFGLAHGSAGAWPTTQLCMTRSLIGTFGAAAISSRPPWT